MKSTPLSCLAFVDEAQVLSLCCRLKTDTPMLLESRVVKVVEQMFPAFKA